MPANSESIDHRLRVAAAMGVAGLALLFILGLRSPTGFYLALFLCLGAALFASPRSLVVLARQPLFWFATFLFLTVFLRGWLDLATASARGFEPDEEAIWHHARYTPMLAIVCGFWVAAWWRLRYALLIGSGVAASVFLSDAWSELSNMVPGGTDNRWSSFPEAGLITATTFFLVAAGSITALSGRLGRAAWRRWLVGAVAGILALFLLSTLVFTLARAAWVGFTAAAGILGMTVAFQAFRNGNRNERRLAFAGLGGCLFAGLVVIVLGWDIFAQRIAKDGNMIALALSGELTQEQVPEKGSFALRYRMLRQGLIDIGQHALIGVGPASVRDMTHELWGMPNVGSGNYHSTWLNLSVAMGLPWAMLWAGVHAWAVGAAVRKLLVVERDRILAYGLLGAAVAHFATLTFQTRVWSVEGSALYTLLMILVFGVLLRRPVEASGLTATSSRRPPENAPA